MSARSDKLLSWTAALFSVWYVAWTARLITHGVSAFHELFTALNAELPYPTRLALALCTPTVVWSAAALCATFLIVKELAVADIRARVILSTIVFMGTACISSVLTELLFQPMFSLIQRLG